MRWGCSFSLLDGFWTGLSLLFKTERRLFHLRYIVLKKGFHLPFALHWKSWYTLSIPVVLNNFQKKYNRSSVFQETDPISRSAFDHRKSSVMIFRKLTGIRCDWIQLIHHLMSKGPAQNILHCMLHYKGKIWHGYGFPCHINFWFRM